MEVARRVSGGEALGAFVKLARATRMTGDEHDQFMLYTQVLKAELDEGTKAQQELAQLKAEHAKCASKPSSTNPVGGEVAGQGNGANVGEDRGSVAPLVAVQESLQRSDEG